MNRNDFALDETVRTDRIYVSWTEHWDIPRYIDSYLRSRTITVTELSRAAILQCIRSYPGRAPYRKADMDYYLDTNVERKVGFVVPRVAARRY